LEPRYNIDVVEGIRAVNDMPERRAAENLQRYTNVQQDVTGPFLKWPGGKRWLVPWLKKFIGELAFDRYFEPFLGGGALFFALSPRRSVLSDINPDLINVYKQAKLQADLIVEKLKTIPVTARTYARLRHSIPEDSVERAVRFLYLNRTAFSGYTGSIERGGLMCRTVVVIARPNPFGVTSC
jgi:hypothetical protein